VRSFYGRHRTEPAAHPEPPPGPARPRAVYRAAWPPRYGARRRSYTAHIVCAGFYARRTARQATQQRSATPARYRAATHTMCAGRRAQGAGRRAQGAGWRVVVILRRRSSDGVVQASFGGPYARGRTCYAPTSSCIQVVVSLYKGYYIGSVGETREKGTEQLCAPW
jgi:hypothetical protein